MVLYEIPYNAELVTAQECPWPYIYELIITFTSSAGGAKLIALGPLAIYICKLFITFTSPEDGANLTAPGPMALNILTALHA